MSLLLDALKSTETDVGTGSEPEPSEPQEEPLDGAATLALLVSKPAAPTILSLVPTSSGAAVPPAPASEFLGPTLVEPSFPEPSLIESGPVAPDPVQPAAVAEMARAAPDPGHAPGAAAGRTTVAAATAPPAAAVAANPRVAATAPPTTPRVKTYALAGAALAALVGIALVGKSLWWPGTNAASYPRVRPEQTPPAVAEATSPSAEAVQVSSARPADRFADAGYAPEIDLRTEPPTRAMTRANAPAPGVIQPASSVSIAPRGAHRTAAAALSVTRSTGPSPIDRHVQAGYESLGMGNILNARTEYSAALELDPNNVDALMGAATVAVRDGRSKDAVVSYAKVLRLEPGNPDATAAMATLGANGSTGENNESRLKILIAGDGGSPALHAALADVYAADLRWSEAAQEYFTALAKDPGNPDLAFDLAASLDQNRNPGMALAYYGQALIFARQRATQIDLHAIEQRMAQLQAHVSRANGVVGTP